MDNQPLIPPKPTSEKFHPELTRLPRLTLRRRLFRKIIGWLLPIVVKICTRSSFTGIDNLPAQGAAILVMNHLGDADAIVLMAYLTRPVEFFCKVELYSYPVLGALLDAYGVIWIHRGQPDRRALRAAMEALQAGRLVGIAPEGRESLTGSLEPGTGGAAYLAYKANVPLVPVTYTGTENSRLYPNLKRLKRTQLTCTIGKMFSLDPAGDRQEAVSCGTQKIMQTLAGQLPPAYRGTYQASAASQEIGAYTGELGG